MKQFEYLLSAGAVEERVPAKHGRFAVHQSIDEEHLLRIIIEEAEGVLRNIAFYPAQRERYESKI